MSSITASHLHPPLTVDTVDSDKQSSNEAAFISLQWMPKSCSGSCPPASVVYSLCSRSCSGKHCFITSNMSCLSGRLAF